MNTTEDIWKRPAVAHTAFWLLVYLYYVISNWDDFPTPAGVFATYTVKVTLQIAVAYTCLLLVLPRWERYKRIPEMVAWYLLIIVVGHIVWTTAKVLYLEQYYTEGFTYCLIEFGDYTLWERLTYWNHLLFITPVDLFASTFIFFTLLHYRRRQQLSELNEQKRTAELSALKHQLNPHFLFNTLNNLYTLALKQSDQTAAAIARLSDILDHILYRCNEPLVPVGQEVELIESYIALEQLRYGDRVEVSLDKSLDHEQRIAPLLLLTFIENAFKHGVSQEIGRARIDIRLRTSADGIDFTVGNSIPASRPVPQSEREGIGLQNIRRQLDLIYPDRHQLRIDSGRDRYELHLKLQPV